MYLGKTISYPNFVDVSGINENTDTENKYRFSLSVPFLNCNNSKNLVVIMKNPSTASKHVCDMTMLKVCNVAYNNGYGGVTVLNLFPIRATIATDLQFFYKNPYYDAIMNNNVKGIINIIDGCDVVFAWGKDTIHSKKDFPKNYDTAIKIVINAVKATSSTVYFVERCSCRGKRCFYDKTAPCGCDTPYPLHGLRWSFNSKLIKY